MRTGRGGISIALVTVVAFLASSAMAWAGEVLATACGNKSEQYPNPQVFYREANPAASPSDRSIPPDVLTRTSSVRSRQDLLREAVQDGDPVTIRIDQVAIPSDGKKRDLAVIIDVDLDGTRTAIVVDHVEGFSGRWLSFKDIATFSADAWVRTHQPRLCVVVMELNERQNEDIRKTMGYIAQAGGFMTGLFAPVSKPVLTFAANGAASLLKETNRPLLQMDIGLTDGFSADSSDIVFRRGGLVVLAPPRRDSPRNFYGSDLYLDQDTGTVFQSACTAARSDGPCKTLIPHQDVPYVVLEVKTASTIPPAIVRERAEAIYAQLQSSDAMGKDINKAISQVGSLSSALQLVQARDDYKKNPSARKLAKFADLVEKNASDPTETKWALAFLRYVTGQTDLDTIEQFSAWINTCSKWYGFDELAKYQYDGGSVGPVTDVSCLPPSSGAQQRVAEAPVPPRTTSTASTVPVVPASAPAAVPPDAPPGTPSM